MVTDTEFISARHGRAFVFSPPWGDDEPAVLFDRNSGDHWLITALARRLIATLLEAGAAMARHDLVCRLAAPAQADSDTEAVEKIIDELVELGILEARPA